MEEGIRGRDIRQESRRRNSEERSGKDILYKEVVCWEEGSGGKDIHNKGVCEKGGGVKDRRQESWRRKVVTSDESWRREVAGHES